MNIIMLAEVSAHTVGGGAPRLLKQQTIGLKERGHTVNIIIRAPSPDSPPSVDVEGITEFRYPVSRASAPAFVISSIGGSLRVFDRVKRIASPDVVIVHQSLAGVGPLWFRRGDSPRWIYACHSLAHEEFLSRNAPKAGAMAKLWSGVHAMIRFHVEHMAMRRSDAITVESQFMKERVIAKHGIPSEKIHVVPGAADVRRFNTPADKKAARIRSGMPPDKIVLFTVRNLVPRMGLANLIRAVAEMGKLKEDLLLLIGGVGPLKSSLEQLIQTLGLESQVTLCGFIPEDDLAAFYQGADLVVMPTCELEGFGLVTVEALACGTPVLGTPVAAIPEILSQIDPCLISEGSDAGSLAKAIRNLLPKMRHDPVGWTRLSRKGRQLTEDTYNWTKHCESLERVLGQP